MDYKVSVDEFGEEFLALGPFISSDSHVIEPPDQWAARVEPKFRSRAPRLIHEAKTDRIVCERIELGKIGLLAGCARKDDEIRFDGRWDEDIMPGAYDPIARIRDQERDGVYGEVIYPTLAMRVFEFADAEFRWALLRAYNDWLADFCAARPDRYKGVAVLMPDDISGSLQEIERSLRMGLSALLLPLVVDSDTPYWDPYYDELWAAAQANAVPIGFHAFTTRAKTDQNLTTVDYVVGGITEPQRVIAGMILSGVFDRFPALQLVSAENDAGWAGNLIERMDWFFRRFRTHRFGRDIRCSELPSTIFRNNVYLTFMRDRTAVAAHGIIGQGNIMWSSDFPHNQATWPNSRKIVEEHFSTTAIEESKMQQIVRENAIRIYGFPPPHKEVI